MVQVSVSADAVISVPARCGVDILSSRDPLRPIQLPPDGSSSDGKRASRLEYKDLQRTGCRSCQPDDGVGFSSGAKINGARVSLTLPGPQ